MDGVDGWAFDVTRGDDPLSRNGAGYVVPPGAPDSGAIVHAVGPVDFAAPWSASFDVVYPTFPFAFLDCSMFLLDAMGNVLLSVIVHGGTDGTPPVARVTTDAGASDGINLASPGPVPSRLRIEYDGAVSWSLFQDGVMIAQNFPVTFGPGSITQVALSLDDDTDLPVASIARVSVPGLA